MKIYRKPHGNLDHLCRSKFTSSASITVRLRERAVMEKDYC